MPRQKQSTRVALGGISASLALTLLLSSMLFPFATYAVPAMAGIVLLPIAIEFSGGVAALSYLAVSLLGILILPDHEVSLLFICFFGYYPILKLKLDRIKHRLFRLPLKLLLFNSTMIVCYTAVIWVFGMAQVAEELSQGFGLLLLLIGNITFPIYEMALRNVLCFYEIRLRRVLFK